MQDRSPGLHATGTLPCPRALPGAAPQWDQRGLPAPETIPAVAGEGPGCIPLRGSAGITPASRTSSTRCRGKASQKAPPKARSGRGGGGFPGWAGTSPPRRRPGNRFFYPTADLRDNGVMATTPAPVSLVRLQALQKDFQQIAAMAGYLNSAVDFPQLRLFFTLFGRILVPARGGGPRRHSTPAGLGRAGRATVCARTVPPPCCRPRPDPAPQRLPSGEGYLRGGHPTFGTKVTENSYQRVRIAVLNAYQAAVALRDKGEFGD